jgi:hypothetical protein
VKQTLKIIETIGAIGLAIGLAMLFTHTPHGQALSVCCTILWLIAYVITAYRQNKEDV